MDVLIQPLLQGRKVPLGNVRIQVWQLGTCSLQNTNQSCCMLCGAGPQVVQQMCWTGSDV